MKAKTVAVGGCFFTITQAPLSMILYTSMGSSIEAFYRSALNSKLNQALTGVSAPLFPDMYQLPL